jgi:O-antigen/teichoic acid export membrane protein
VNSNSAENSIDKLNLASAPNERRKADWDIKNAPKNYLSLLLTQGGGSFFAFASVWLMSKIIGSEGYGGVVAITAASQIAQIFVNWTSYSVARFGTEEFIETEKIARIFWVRLLFFLPNLLLVVLAVNFWFLPLSDWLKLPAESFWLVILHFAASGLWIHVQSGLQAVKLPRIQGFLMMFERLLIFAGMTVFLGTGKLSSLTAIFCYAVAPLLMVITGTWYLRRFLFARFTFDSQFFRRFLNYSLPLLPFTLIGFFSAGYVDVIFISKYLSTRELGIYFIAAQTNGILLQLPTLANSLLLPLFVSLQKELQDDRATDYFRQVLPNLTLFWGFACAVLSFAGYFAIPLIFGAEFTEAVFPFWILLTSSSISLPVLLGYSALSNATSNTYISMYAAISSAVGNIAANFLLIPKYGMEGCAWATIIAYLIGCLTFGILLRQKVKMPFPSWVFIVMVPAISGGLCFSLTKNPWLSLLVCLILNLLVIYFRIDSIKQTLGFIKNIRKR